MRGLRRVAWGQGRAPGRAAGVYASVRARSPPCHCRSAVRVFRAFRARSRGCCCRTCPGRSPRAPGSTPGRVRAAGPAGRGAGGVPGVRHAVGAGARRLPAAAARRPGRRPGRRDRAGGAAVPLRGPRLPEGHVHRAGRRPDLAATRGGRRRWPRCWPRSRSALCGRAGARLAAAPGIAAPGRATMTRLVMTAPVPEPGSAPRVLGRRRLRAAQRARLRHRADRRGNRAGRRLLPDRRPPPSGTGCWPIPGRR